MNTSKILITLLLSLISIMAKAQSKVNLSVGNRSVTAVLVDNVATRELKSLLEKGPIKVDMSDYGGFEKVGALPQSFPTSNSRITTKAGDIMLYQGNSIVIFYSSNTWSYTPLGSIEGATPESVREFLGSGNISLIISLESAGIEQIESDVEETPTVYNMQGIPVTRNPLKPGLYIIDGKKTYIK